ncbi:uncharacterized protein LOC125496711 [Beta vulgaris subsp. vulgaris]|uniref:uncharacterized protein LOC125496711 n=1 Tax=Beta vulgaris subsp. vulgaris TaxID=3555 RepID=UPI00203738A3|nr:uncharacterized protein LOC125496711 [Beta vulgaris subsp. vulgaris]
MKNQLKAMFTKAEFYMLTQYKVGKIYDMMMGETLQVYMYWCNMVWNRLSIPRRRFISWLVVQHRSQTTEKLARIGVSSSLACVICDQGDEIHKHLFSECPYIKISLLETKSWFGITVATQSLNRLIVWIDRSKKSKFRKNVWHANIYAFVYSVWRCKNDSYWQDLITRPHFLTDNCKRVVKERIRVVLPTIMAR